jgi:hypothetical protein
MGEASGGSIDLLRLKSLPSLHGKPANAKTLESRAHIL